MGESIHLETIAALKKSRLGGGSEKTINKLVMIESFHSEKGKPSYTGTVLQIMGLGSFQVRFKIRSGEKPPEVLQFYGGIVLGLLWDTDQDIIKLKMEVNLSAKKQGKVCAALKPDEVNVIKESVLMRGVKITYFSKKYNYFLLNRSKICNWIIQNIQSYLKLSF